MRTLFSVSVGRRLALLVAVESGMACLLVFVTYAALSSIREQVAFTDRFVLAPVWALTDALGHGTHLVAVTEDARRSSKPVDPRALERSIDRLSGFLSRYRVEWAVAANPSHDAARFRMYLQESGLSDLPDRELEAVSKCEQLTRQLTANLAISDRLTARSWEQDTKDLKRTLNELMDVNVEYVKIANSEIEAKVDRTVTYAALVGIASVVLATALGLHARAAIAPRIRRLVSRVTRFKEAGTYVQLLDPGHDEIAILANALDKGFSAIIERERERDRFLAVAAHELKTPLTSLAGFAQLALRSPEQTELRTRALGVIRRQTHRLNRLVDDLLLAARSRTQDLSFDPAPIDLTAIVRRVAFEVMAEIPDRRFDVENLGPVVNVLADERLISHAVLSILTYAAAVSPAEVVVPVHVTSDSRATIAVEVVDGHVSVTEAERGFEPFGSVQYEGSGVRNAIGLFLCREIARLHGGSAGARPGQGDRVVLEIQLPL
jgi:signal transduction histidine kinase